MLMLMTICGQAGGYGACGGGGEQPKEVEEGEVATKEVLAEQCQRTILQAQAPRMPAIISVHLQLQATREMGRSVLPLHKWAAQ